VLLACSSPRWPPLDWPRPGSVEAERRGCRRPVLANQLLITQWASGVTAVMTRQLVHALRSMPAALAEAEVDTVYELARRSTTWTMPRR